MAIVIAVPFLISFGSLRDLAYDNGVAYPLLYPIMVDGGLLIFKALALRESLRGRRDWYTWTMAAALTAVSVALNVVHAPAGDVLAQMMAALPPALILLAFIAVSRRIEQAAKHEAAVMTLVDLDTAVSDRQAEIDSLDDTLDAMTAERMSLADDIEQLKRQRETAVSDIAAGGDGGAGDKATDKAAPGSLPVDAPDFDNLTDRQHQILAMLQNGQDDKAAIADRLGVSERTVYRDINRMNGAVATAIGGAS
jgi:DNA-binding NarL/FixJ family response regulator